MKELKEAEEEEGHLRFAMLRVKKWPVQGSESPGEKPQDSRTHPALHWAVKAPASEGGPAGRDRP